VGCGMKNKQLGVFYILLSGFFFASMSLFVKLAGDLPSMQKVLFRNLIALAIALMVIQRSGLHFTWQRKNFPLLIIRSLAGTLGIVCNFYALDHMILSDATILNKLSPFFVIIFSRIILKERIKLQQIFYVVGAFMGAALIVKPSFSEITPLPNLLALVGGISAGFAYTIVRILGNRGIPAPIIVAFFSLFSTLFAVPFVLFSYESMTLMQWMYLLLAGITAAGGQFSITKAYSYAPAKEISVFDYAQVLFTSILSIVFFAQFPDAASLTGYVIIALMAVLMFFHNKREVQDLPLSTL
ncbi:MAG: DMT family transporter, partial [Sphaerochaeta sp.]